MYESGTFVMYGIHGVCRVVGTQKQMVNRKRTEFLVLEPLRQQESRFYVPTQNPTAMEKLKPVLSSEQMESLMASEDIRRYSWTGEENLRKQQYRELIGSGNRSALLTSVYSLYRYRAEQTAAGRKFHQCDENFLHDAERLLCSEISLVLGLDHAEAVAYLREQLG